MIFLFFTKQNVRARKFGRVSEILRALARSIGIGRAICPGLPLGFIIICLVNVMISI